PCPCLRLRVAFARRCRRGRRPPERVPITRLVGRSSSTLFPFFLRVLGPPLRCVLLLRGESLRRGRRRSRSAAEGGDRGAGRGAGSGVGVLLLGCGRQALMDRLDPALLGDEAFAPRL